MLKDLFSEKFLEILNRFPNHLLTIEDMIAVMAVSVTMSILFSGCTRRPSKASYIPELTISP